MDKYVNCDLTAESAFIHAKRKFSDPDTTATGEKRAQVQLLKLNTLWINTGTLCNIKCANCYIESSPTNDRLVYFSYQDAIEFFTEIKRMNMQTHEIGFTGGEPFMNPDMIKMIRAALEHSFNVLILTNAMMPMQRPKIKQGLLELKEKFAEKLTIRASLDHYRKELHEMERGIKSWDKTIQGIDWLAANKFKINICGRTCWGEQETHMREHYGRLFRQRNWQINPADPAQLVLLPEMEENIDVPEITRDCWNILGVKPESMMCATSRMVVKRKGAQKPTVLPCTLLPYDKNFEMGHSLRDSLNANGAMFNKGAVKLNHPYCSKFCVLGGGSCSVQKD